MADHLSLFVGRLLTESATEDTIESRRRERNMQQQHSASATVPIVDLNEEEEVGKGVECRICQEEDDDSNMEIPCSCNGSLKYAHRKCVQRWCNEKGDTTCEICLQQFKPGYTAPHLSFHFGNIPMDFRRNWEDFSRDFHESQFITMVPTDRGVVDSSDDDYNFFSGNQSTICCRSVALIFMTLLVLRHSLPLLLCGAEEYYSPSMFLLLVLRIAGILVPVVIIARSLTIFHHRQRQQVTRSIPISGSDIESVRSRSIYQPRSLIRVH